MLGLTKKKGRIDRTGRSLHTIYTVHQMRQALARERARCDRNHHGFVLAIFRPTSGRWWTRQRLARLLCRRARVMDEVGWCDANGVGVILPYASEESAQCFAREIERQAAMKRMEVHSSISTYDPRPEERGGPPGPGSDHHDAPRDRRGLVQPATAGELFLTPLPKWKRVMDILGALVGIALAAPVMLVAAIAIKLTSPGPVLFLQRRSGWGGQTFTIFKFRTMVVGAEKLRDDLKPLSEQDGPAFKLTNDPRVTAIGRFLRATSLDELPQLFNVLRGDMSLVGPRPLPIAESCDCAPWHKARLDVMPGLTCIWQVRGRSQVPFDDWMRMDLQYIRSRSLFNDLRIIFQTLPAVIMRRGAH